MINQIHTKDNRLLLAEMGDNSIDAIVTDPPYGISFMNKKWDYDIPDVDFWRECLRVVKPGGYILVACGTRTQHRMACNIEDAGFLIRDIVAWCYGSGFPKGRNIAIDIDKIQGIKSEFTEYTRNYPIISTDRSNHYRPYMDNYKQDDGKLLCKRSIATSELAKQFEGFNTALKPAMELFTLAQKPLSEKTYAENVIKWGTGAMNIGACKIGDEDMSKQWDREWKQDNTFGNGKRSKDKSNITSGRYPANFIHDGSAEVLELFPNNSQDVDSSVARYFYCAKASPNERNKGCENFELRQETDGNIRSNKNTARMYGANHTVAKNTHPTVKPIALMRYLVRLITPPDGIVFDPFVGSGTTAIAAKLENKNFIACELDEIYCQIANARLKAW